MRSNFTDLEKVWKIEIKSGKNGKIPECFFLFFKATTSGLKVNFFVLFKCYSILPVRLQRTMKKYLFLRLLRSLFKNLESEKRNYSFEKKSAKSVEFWIQKSVRTLNKLFSSFICYRERALINDYFTLLASLEYNMQEIQKVQKLANDLVDITVTVR